RQRRRHDQGERRHLGARDDAPRHRHPHGGGGAGPAGNADLLHQRRRQPRHRPPRSRRPDRGRQEKGLTPFLPIPWGGGPRSGGGGSATAEPSSPSASRLSAPRHLPTSWGGDQISPASGEDGSA